MRFAAKDAAPHRSEFVHCPDETTMLLGASGDTETAGDNPCGPPPTAAELTALVIAVTTLDN